MAGAGTQRSASRGHDFSILNSCKSTTAASFSHKSISSPSLSSSPYFFRIGHWHSSDFHSATSQALLERDFWGYCYFSILPFLYTKAESEQSMGATANNRHQTIHKSLILASQASYIFDYYNDYNLHFLAMIDEKRDFSNAFQTLWWSLCLLGNLLQKAVLHKPQSQLGFSFLDNNCSRFS